jgi:threonine/homoserine/homoserine lactone efflux protein
MSVEPVLAGLGLGLALASAPGPVQAVLLSEAVAGGVGRGFRAMAGASATFGFLLVAAAIGISVATPDGLVLRILQVGGGALLLWLAADAFRSGGRVGEPGAPRRSLPVPARGALAVLVNPGAWLFLGAVASPLFATATREGGTWSALVTSLALIVGLAVGDGAVVVLGGVGMRRAGDRVRTWVARALALVLAGLGAWLLLTGVMSG